MNLKQTSSTSHIVACLVTVLTLTTEAFRLDRNLRKRNFLSGVGEEKPHKLFFNEEVPPERKEVSLGEKVVIECSAGGSPSPTIHWLYNGERLQQSERNVIEDETTTFENTPKNRKMSLLKLSSTKAKLTIDCVTPEDQGTYTCVASTPYNTITADTEMYVGNDIGGDVSERCVVKKSGNGVPARVYMWTSQRLEKQGADVQLYCRGDGHPAPTVQWIDNNGNHINPGRGGKEQVLENGDLLIKNIQWLENMGNYKCKVENEYGSETVETFLYPTV
ncbi:unnamed protein product [Owenia fusiformis]|uniref:Uncharacterized protein n=1 Tax=Owenia fusiformis TaxID=6347 RepID=A0A8J1T4V9_OWEFU|nr:unnamed protein product [Owenia fusiformis]